MKSKLINEILKFSFEKNFILALLINLMLKTREKRFLFVDNEIVEKKTSFRIVLVKLFIKNIFFDFFQNLMNFFNTIFNLLFFFFNQIVDCFFVILKNNAFFFHEHIILFAFAFDRIVYN